MYAILEGLCMDRNVIRLNGKIMRWIFMRKIMKMTLMYVDRIKYALFIEG